MPTTDLTGLVPAGGRIELDTVRLDSVYFDTDTHVIEPYDLWTSRAPKGFEDRVLKVVEDRATSKACRSLDGDGPVHAEGWSDQAAAPLWKARWTELTDATVTRVEFPAHNGATLRGHVFARAEEGREEAAAGAHHARHRIHRQGFGADDRHLRQPEGRPRGDYRHA